jgi:hypothetical protein
MTKTKRCPKCGITKPLRSFYADRRSKDEHSTYCKLCARETARDHYVREKQNERRSRSDTYKNYMRQYMRDRRERDRQVEALTKALQSGNS